MPFSGFTPCWTKVGGKYEYGSHYREMLGQKQTQRQITPRQIRFGREGGRQRVQAPTSMTPRTASREIFNIDLQAWMAHGSVDDISHSDRARGRCRGDSAAAGGMGMRINWCQQPCAGQRRPESGKTVQSSHRENLVRHFLEKTVQLQTENQRLNAESRALREHARIQTEQVSDLREDHAMLLLQLEESVRVNSLLRAQLASAHQELAQIKSAAASRHQVYPTVSS